MAVLNQISSHQSEGKEKEEPSLLNNMSRPLLREGNGTPLQYSCLENPTDGGAW